MWRAALTSFLVLAALGFVAVRIARDWDRLRSFHWELDVGQLALSLVALVAVLCWGVFVWRRVLTHFDHPVAYVPLARIWYVSSLTRYIPGKIWQFVSAAQLARVAGVAAPTLLTSLLVYMGLSVLSAAIIAATTLPQGAYELGPHGTRVLVALAVGSVFLVHPLVINRGLSVLPRLLRKEAFSWTARWRDGLYLLLLCLVSWLGYGLAFALFMDSLVAIDPQWLLPLTGVNALGFLVGYLVFLTPAGLGPREAAMTLLLSPYVPAGVAAVVAIFSRIWMIGAELAGALVATGLARRRARSSPLVTK